MEGVEEIEIYVQPNDYLGPLMDASGKSWARYLQSTGTRTRYFY